MITATPSLAERGIALERLSRRASDVSSLPDVVARVIQVINDPESSAADLQTVVESDVSIVSKMLRLVNSSACGVTKRVDSIHRAIALLGFNAVKNIALTMSVAKVFQGGSQIGPYSRPALWEHLVSVAVASRMVAARCGIPQFDEAYMCGLLHDVGIIIIDQYLHKDFVRVMESVNSDQTLSETEESILGYNHTHAGATVGESWGFPASVIDTIRYHHQPASCPRDEHRTLANVVQIANFLCTSKGVPSVTVCRQTPPSIDTFNEFGIGRTALKAMLEDLTGEFDQARELMAI